jgi:N-acetylmuramoyl-L-alanine amidase
MTKKKLITTVWMLSVVFYLFSAGTGNAAASDKYKVIADSLRVRSEPTLKASVIGSLKSGDVVAVTKESHGWLQVKSGKLSGWVAGYYLKKSDVETAAAAKPEDKPKAEAPAKASEEPKTDEPAKQADKPKAEVDAAVEEGQSAAEPAKPAADVSADEPASEQEEKPAGELAVGGKVYVTADALRVRSAPGLDRKVAGAVYHGDELTVLELGEEWVKVEAAQGLIGWVAAQYVSTATPAKTPANVEGPLTGRIIAVDPGHGGNDPGMVGVKHKTYEKDLNLSTSLYLKEELEKLGAKVVMTRTEDDEKPELSERVRIAEEAGSDAFISVHYNSSPKKVSGTLTFYYSQQDDRKLARAVESELAKGIGLKSNGISYGNFHVLRENDVPAALVELGFLTNEKDEEIARTEEYQRAAAAAIAQGLVNYLSS